jgi:uncharacterized protein (DUF1330 family)
VAITPTREQFTEFAQGRQEGEVVMINLLHFDRTGAPERSAAKDDGVEGESSGKDAYRHYSDQVIKMVEARGGKVIWTGRPEQVLIGDTDADVWDLVALVSYPSRAAFIDMVTSPSYGEAHGDRERGLDRTVLLACEPMLNSLSSRDEGAAGVGPARA